MITWQDFQKVGEQEQDRMNFVRQAIDDYKNSDVYETASVAHLYMRHENPDIMRLEKMIYEATGERVRDEYSSNYKVGRGFFPYFVTQQIQYLLSNGATWENKDTADKLGTKKFSFDVQLKKAAKAALWGGVSYGLWNFDHVDVFNALEFCPIYDEENGALRAGVRWWQIDENKPFRATLYEEDGYTDYIWNRQKDNSGSESEYGEVLHEKRAYKIKIITTQIDSEQIYQGTNYPSFPIVSFWANDEHQNVFASLRNQIFLYDVIMSGFANNIEDASYVYWAIHNAPGMLDEDFVKFLQKVRRLHVVSTDDEGSFAEPRQIETPYQAREALLHDLERSIFKDAMAFDPESVVSGAATATEIKAAYENLKMKTNDFEYQVLEFVEGIMQLAGVEDAPTFTRDSIVNESEMISVILNASQVLSQDYVTKKIMTLLGDGDQANSVLEQMAADETTRWQEMETIIDE